MDHKRLMDLIAEINSDNKIGDNGWTCNNPFEINNYKFEYGKIYKIDIGGDLGDIIFIDENDDKTDAHISMLENFCLTTKELKAFERKEKIKKLNEEKE